MLRLPKSVVFELTYKCNLSCVYCSSPWNAPSSTYPQRNVFSLSQWKEAIDKLLGLGVKHFTLSGGECLLNEDFANIIEYLRNQTVKAKYELDITIISNGKLIDQDLLFFLAKNNVHLCMSLPALNAYTQLTGVDNVDHVLSLFKSAREIGLTTTANITVTAVNYKEIFETVSVALAHGASMVLLNRFLPGGRGLKHKHILALNAKQLNSALHAAEIALSTAKRDGFTGTEFPKCIVEDHNSYNYLRLGYKCSAAKEFFVIDPAGQIRVCNHSATVLGNIANQIFIENTDYWDTFCDRKYQPEMCSACSDKNICDCGCREVANICRGAVNHPDELIAL